MAEYRADDTSRLLTETINRLAIVETKLDIALKLLVKVAAEETAEDDDGSASS